MITRIAGAALAALTFAPLASAADFIPITEAMKQGAPTEYALVRCAAISRATAEWIADKGGDASVAEGLAQRASAFDAAADRAAEGTRAASDSFVGEWLARFADSGREGDRAWQADPVWAKDMTVCDQIAAAAAGQ